MIEIIPADQLSLREQAGLFTEAFAGYIGGSFEMDSTGLARFLCVQGADLCHSRFARSAGRLCGFGYINCTGGITRIAGMGVLPAVRRTGVARQLLQHLIAEARERSDEAIVLEVIEQNPAAHALYKGAGFRDVAHLLGWRRTARANAREPLKGSDALTQTSLMSATQVPSALEFPELPWAVSRHAVAKVFAAKAYSCDKATIVISDPKGIAPIRVHFLSIPESGANEWVALRQALTALLQRFPGREFFTPPVFPERFGREVFAPLDFVQETLAQFLMRYDPNAAWEGSCEP